MVKKRWLGIGMSAVVVLLAGCGASTSSSSSSTTSNQPSATSAPTSSAPTAPTSSAPASSAPASSAPATATSTSSASTSSDGGGSKPSRSDTIAGLARFYENKQHLSSGKAQKFATCMVGQMYDKASPSTITAMRDGDPTKISTSDRNLLGESAVKCSAALK